MSLSRERRSKARPVISLIGSSSEQDERKSQFFLISRAKQDRVTEGCSPGASNRGVGPILLECQQGVTAGLGALTQRARAHWALVVAPAEQSWADASARAGRGHCAADRAGL